MIFELTSEQEARIKKIDDLIEYHAADLRSLEMIGDMDETERAEYDAILLTIKELQALQSIIRMPPIPAEARIEALIDEHILVLRRAHRYEKQIDYIREQLTQGWPINERNPEPSVNQIKLEILEGMEGIG